MNTWRLRAACRDLGPAIFFPKDGNTDSHAYDEARSVCASCVVRADCLNWALTLDEEGFWGGYTDEQRKRVKKWTVASRAS